MTLHNVSWKIQLFHHCEATLPSGDRLLFSFNYFLMILGQNIVCNNMYVYEEDDKIVVLNYSDMLPFNNNKRINRINIFIQY